MKQKFDMVYQFKITLLEISPPIWRRVQVPDSYTFWDLHVSIQDAMGWLDCHLHQFELINPNTGKESFIGIPSDTYEYENREGLPEKKHKITKWFSMEYKKALYEYDFGDNWEHSVELEKILPRDKNVNYPICVSGERACPPEDCGSAPGYERLCEIMKDKDDEEYEEMVGWLSGEYDPEHFNIDEIIFDDPAVRFKTAFS